MGVLDLVVQFENNASCEPRECKENVYMCGKLVKMSRENDIWSFLDDFVSKMSSSNCAQKAEIVQLFAKSLEGEIRKFELEQSTDTLVVQVCHPRYFESEDEKNLRILLCLSSVCKEIVHLFYSVCKANEPEIVDFFAAILHRHHELQKKTPQKTDTVRQTLQSQLTTKIRLRNEISAGRLLSQLEQEIHAYNELSRDLGNIIQ